MFKLLTIALLLAPVPAMAEEAWERTLSEGFARKTEQDEAFRRKLHDMKMESHALRQEIEMHNQNITQEGIRDQMMLNGDNPYWR